MSQEYGTIKIPQDAYEKHNERRRELGLTWEQYINGESPELPDYDPLSIADAVKADLKDELANDVANEIERRLR